MNKNCPNCGAPYDVNLNKCPYCSTSYFDISAMDINNQQPFYLKLRYGDKIFTSKVIADPCINFNFCKDIRQYTNLKGVETNSAIIKNDFNIDIQFHSIIDDKGNLFTMMYESS